MTEGHCLLTPKEHFPNLPSCDETVAREMLNIRRLFGFYNKTYSIKSNFTLTLSRFENLKDATLIISIIFVIFAKDRNYDFNRNLISIMNLIVVRRVSYDQNPY